MRCLILALILMGTISVAAQNPVDTLRSKRNGRWGVSLSGNIEPFLIPDLEYRSEAVFGGLGLSIRWDRSLRTTWRITHTRSMPSTSTYQATQSDYLTVTTYDIRRDLWLIDTRFEFIRRIRQLTTHDRGVYGILGLAFRTIWISYHVDPTPPIMWYGSWSLYPQVESFHQNDLKEWLELYGVLIFGAGYDHRAGPVDVFVEASAEVSFLMAVYAAGPPLSVRPRGCFGVSYRFGRAAGPGRSHGHSAGG